MSQPAWPISQALFLARPGGLVAIWGRTSPMLITNAITGAAVAACRQRRRLPSQPRAVIAPVLPTPLPAPEGNTVLITAVAAAPAAPVVLTPTVALAPPAAAAVYAAAMPIAGILRATPTELAVRAGCVRPWVVAAAAEHISTPITVLP